MKMNRFLLKGLNIGKVGESKFNFTKFCSKNISNFMKRSGKTLPSAKVLTQLKYFSTETEDTHSDFKPKVKQELNEENVTKLIDEWVKTNDVVLFMKGTREMPRCGFSNYVVQILNFYKIKNVKGVNILEGQILREAVKQYSNWPTYPQLYIKGSLIGGCDIIKEMHENGTLKELVERESLNKATE